MDQWAQWDVQNRRRLTEAARIIDETRDDAQNLQRLTAAARIIDEARDAKTLADSAAKRVSKDKHVDCTFCDISDKALRFLVGVEVEGVKYHDETFLDAGLVAALSHHDSEGFMVAEICLFVNAMRDGLSNHCRNERGKTAND